MGKTGWMLLLLFSASQALAAGDVKKGGEIFKARCQLCHGPGGDSSKAMKAAANFAKLDANIPRVKDLLKSLSEADHKKIVKEGGTGSKVKGAGAAMPKLGLSDPDVDNVVAYERTLPAFKKR